MLLKVYSGLLISPPSWQPFKMIIIIIYIFSVIHCQIYLLWMTCGLFICVFTLQFFKCIFLSCVNLGLLFPISKFLPLPRSQLCPLVLSSESLMVFFTCISVIHLELLLVCAVKRGSRHTFESIWRTNCLSVVYWKHHLSYCFLDHDSNFDLWAPFCTITHFPFSGTNAAWPQDLRLSLQRNYRFPALPLPLKVLSISMSIFKFYDIYKYHITPTDQFWKN